MARFRLLCQQRDPVRAMCEPISLPAFRYQSLQNRTDFRVIILSPGDENEPVKCRMQVCAHNDRGEDKVPYEALSYVWGDPTDITPIECDSALLDVPRTLYTALRHLRWLDHPRTLWADAICINQQDAEEKSVQVQAMGKIYSKAVQVLMWQGEISEDTQDSMTSLAQLCALAIAEPDSEEWQEFQFQALCANNVGFTSQTANYLSQDRNPNWASIVALIRRPYFRRRWIVQEVLLARKAIMVLGTQTLDWALISERLNKFDDSLHIALSTICKTLTNGQSGLWLRFSRMVSATRAKTIYKVPASTSFYDALWDMSSLECFDNRDRIYALLHIVPDVDLTVDAELTPDYTLDEVEVLHRLAVWIIVRRRHPSYMSFAIENLHDYEKEHSRLPT